MSFLKDIKTPALIIIYLYVYVCVLAALFSFCADIMESNGVIPVVNPVRESTAEQSTSSVATSNRVFDFRWNELIKKTNKIPQQSVTDVD